MIKLLFLLLSALWLYIFIVLANSPLNVRREGIAKKVAKEKKLLFPAYWSLYLILAGILIFLTLEFVFIGLLSLAAFSTSLYLYFEPVWGQKIFDRIGGKTKREGKGIYTKKRAEVYIEEMKKNIILPLRIEQNNLKKMLLANSRILSVDISPTDNMDLMNNSGQLTLSIKYLKGHGIKEGIEKQLSKINITEIPVRS